MAFPETGTIIDLDFVNNRYWDGASEVAFSNLMALTRTTVGTSLDTNNNPITHAIGQPRITNRGLYVSHTLNGENADNIAYANALLSALTGAVRSVVVEFERPAGTGGSSGFARLYHSGSPSTHTRIMWIDVPAGTVTVSSSDGVNGVNAASTNAYTFGTIGRAAHVWNNGQPDKVCLNGGPVITATAPRTVGTITSGRIGSRGDNSRYLSGYIRRILIFDRVLSDAEMQAWTSEPVVGGVSLAPPLVSNTSSIFAPVIGQGPVSLAPSLLTNASTVFAPSVTGSLVPTYKPVYLYSVAPGSASVTLRDPETTAAATPQSLAAPLATNVSNLFAPSVGRGSASLQVPLVANVSVVHVPTLARGSVSISPPRAVNTNTLFGPVLGRGAVVVTAPFLNNTSTLFGPTIRGPQSVVAPRVANVSTVFAPVVANGGAIVTPLVGNVSTIFAASVSKGSVTLGAAQITNLSTVFSPSVGRGAVIVPAAFVTNMGAIFAPTVLRSSRIEPEPVSNVSAVYPALVLGGEPPSGLMPTKTAALLVF